MTDTQTTVSTVTSYADANNSDRRTVKRRLSANGIKPVRSHRGFQYFAVEDLDRVMMLSKPRASAQSRTMSASVGDQRFGDGMDHALFVIGEALPDALRSSLAQAKIEASKPALDAAACRLWAFFKAEIDRLCRHYQVESIGDDLPVAIQQLVGSVN